MRKQAGETRSEKDERLAGEPTIEPDASSIPRMTPRSAKDVPAAARLAPPPEQLEQKRAAARRAGAGRPVSAAVSVRLPAMSSDEPLLRRFLVDRLERP
jgi:hypothetical protein